MIDGNLHVQLQEIIFLAAWAETDTIVHSIPHVIAEAISWNMLVFDLPPPLFGAHQYGESFLWYGVERNNGISQVE